MIMRYMKLKRGSLAAIITAAFLISGGGTHARPGGGAMTEADGLKESVLANNQFALDFYLNIKNNGENVFFSPVSISAALSLAYEGARGRTADEIRSVLRLPDDNNLRKSAAAALHSLLNSEDSKHTLNSASSLWIHDGFHILDEFRNTAEKYYSAKTVGADFINKTEESRRSINSWVEELTNDKIQDLFPEGTISQGTRLVLANAVYFRGDWLKMFDAENTRDEDFNITLNKSVKVPMMRRTDSDSRFNYAETENLQILEMLYEGEELSMIVLLPAEGYLDSLGESLTAENLKRLTGQLEKQRVDVYMPKFSLERRYSLNETLRDMGMPSAFIDPKNPEGADFSGITGNRDLYISNVIHKSFIEVSEEGTEAAAATGVGFQIVSHRPVPEFRADRPFIFFIQERETGAIIFIGRVVNPQK